MGNSVEVSKTDNRTLVDNLIKQFDMNSDYYIGIFADSDPEEAQKGIFNEYGTLNAPPRPFLMPTVLANEKFLIQKIESKLKKLENPHMFMNDMANIFLGKVKHKIDVMKYPVLSPLTIQRKGHGKLLKDSYKMYNALQVRKEDNVK